MLEPKIRENHTQTNCADQAHADQANLIHQNLGIDCLVLKPFWLCASSILSMAIVFSAPVRAEQLPALVSQNTTSEFDAPLGSEPSIENLTAANFDQVVFEEELLTSTETTDTVEAIPPVPPLASPEGDELELADVEPTIESTNIEPAPIIESTSIEPAEPTERPLPSDSVAQDDEPVPQPEPFPSPESDNDVEAPLREGWQFSVEPYFYVPFDVDADITVDGRSTSLDLGLDDILDLDRVFDAGLRLEAQNNRWGIILDGFYVFGERSGRLGQTFAAGSLLQFVQRVAPENLQQFRQQFDPQQLQRLGQLGQRIRLSTPVQISANGTVSIRQITVDAAVSYRAVDTSFNSSNSSEAAFYPRLVVAPILGVRTNFLRQSIEVNTIRIDNAPIPDDAIPRIDRKFRFSRTLVEPLVGAEVGLALSERWALGLRGDVSGFNIGADQNLTWNLLAGVQYRLSRLASLQLAYRFNSFDFEDGEGFARARLNLRQNGLWLSAMFQF
jgi:hypothetical protein